MGRHRQGHKEKESSQEKEIDVSGSMTAKRDFVLKHNEHYYDIKKGQDCSSIPKMFHQNLKTEKVLEGDK